MPCHDADSTCAPLWHFSGKYFLTACNRISCLAVNSLSARRSHNQVSFLVGASLTWSLWSADVDRTGNWSAPPKHGAEKPLPWYPLCVYSYCTASCICSKQWTRTLERSGWSLLFTYAVYCWDVHRLCNSTEPVYGAVFPELLYSRTLFGFEK